MNTPPTFAVLLVDYERTQYYSGPDYRPKKIPFIKDLRDALKKIPGAETFNNLRANKNICDAYYEGESHNGIWLFDFRCQDPHNYAQFIKGVFMGYGFTVKITYVQEHEL